MILTGKQIKEEHREITKDFINSIKKCQVVRFRNLLDKRSKDFIDGLSLMTDTSPIQIVEGIIDEYQVFLKPVCSDTNYYIYQVQEFKDQILLVFVKNENDQERIFPFIKEDGVWKFNLIIDWEKVCKEALERQKASEK